MLFFLTHQMGKDWKVAISQYTEDVDKQTVSSAIGGAENWGNVFGEHFGNIQQNEGHIYLDLPTSPW